MDKITKFLKSLRKKERQILLLILADIRNLDVEKYDIKALKGMKDIFRIRRGKFRIVFAKVGGKGVLIDVVYRKDAYK